MLCGDGDNRPSSVRADADAVAWLAVVKSVSHGRCLLWESRSGEEKKLSSFTLSPVYDVPLEHIIPFDIEKRAEQKPMPLGSRVYAAFKTDGKVTTVLYPAKVSRAYDGVGNAQVKVSFPNCRSEQFFKRNYVVFLLPPQ